MSALNVKRPFSWRGILIAEAVPAIDWVSFDRVNKKAEFVIGIYKDSGDASLAENRLDIRHISYSGDEYDQMIQDHPDIFIEIVEEVSLIATEKYPNDLELG